jgi:hypothetical protein
MRFEERRLWLPIHDTELLDLPPPADENRVELARAMEDVS